MSNCDMHFLYCRIHFLLLVSWEKFSQNFSKMFKKFQKIQGFFTIKELAKYKFSKLVKNFLRLFLVGNRDIIDTPTRKNEIVNRMCHVALSYIVGVVCDMSFVLEPFEPFVSYERLISLVTCQLS